MTPTEMLSRVPTPDEQPTAWLLVFVACTVALVVSLASFIDGAVSAGLVTHRQAAASLAVGSAVGMVLWYLGVI